MPPFFTIAVTTYDREEMLQETLNSIFSQTFTDYEVIVSNDNPTRNISGESLGVTDKRARFINQPVNLGECLNMNYLLQNSSGRYFTWINDDDLYLPEFLEFAYRTLTKYSFPKCVFTSFEIFQKEIPVIRIDNFNHQDELLSGDEFLYRYTKGKLEAAAIMGLFESKTIKEIGGVKDICGDGTAMFAETKLIVEIGMLDKIAYINMPLVLARQHKGSWSYKNIDLVMHRRGADNLARQCIEIFKSPVLRNHFYTYLYFILNLCITCNLIIMAKRKSLGDKSLKKVIAYLIYARRYIDSLKASRLYLIGLIVLIHVEINIILSFIGRKIRKILCRDLFRQQEAIEI